MNNFLKTISALFVFLACFAGWYYAGGSSVTTYYSDDWDGASFPYSGFWDAENDSTGDLLISGTVYRGASGDSMHLRHDASLPTSWVYEQAMNLTGVVWTTFYIRFDNNTGLGGSTFLIFCETEAVGNSDFWKVEFRADASGNLQYLQLEAEEDDTTESTYQYDISSGGANWQNDTWYKIEVESYEGTGSDGYVSLYTDGTLRGSITGKDFSDKEVDDLMLGARSSSMTITTLDVYFDDFALSDGRL
jgi:hypothetical protein